MRIPPARLLALALPLVLTVGCGNATGDAAPTTTSTLRVVGTTPSTAPSNPEAPSNAGTPSTTTVASVDTTLPPPSTTEPERFEAFTTDEMKEELAGTHVYLGGWVVDADFEWAVEQWGRGDDDVAGWYAAGGEMELWVSSLVERTADGTPVWQRTDVVVTMYRPEDGWAFSGNCRLGAEPTAGVVAWYPVEDGAEQWTPAVEAWRIDFETGRMAPIGAGVVDCENETFGI